MRNRRNNHKFFFSFLLFIFCNTRIAALSLRIAWARAPRDPDVAIAATVLTSAGVLILFLVNLVLARRVVRALHPGFGWARSVTWAFKALLASVIATLVMVVTCAVHSMFTLDVGARMKERDVLLFAGVYMTVLAFLPTVAVVVAKLVPNRGPHEAESFGKRSMEHKMALLVFTSVLLTLGAGFRAGVNFAPRPIAQPAWYHSRGAFYAFNFAIELTVVYAYAIFRFDQMFHVPEGSSAPGHYSGKNLEAGNTKGSVQARDAEELNDLADNSRGSATTEGSAAK